MASRRKLKKTIQFAASDLITDVYVRCLTKKDFDAEKIDNIVMEISALANEFVLRASRPDGKNNPILVKAYYRALFAEWQVKTSKIISEIQAI